MRRLLITVFFLLYLATLHFILVMSLILEKHTKLLVLRKLILAMKSFLVPRSIRQSHKKRIRFLGEELYEHLIENLDVKCLGN